MAIKTGHRVPEARQWLSLAVDPMLEAIRVALPEETAGNGAGAAGDPAAIVKPLARLKQLLETDDGEAADFIVDAKSRLLGVLTPAEIKTLTECWQF
jgi:hypothetical protein